MKRLTAAGIFAMIGGAATLLLVASILYSCRQGGHPHEMGNTSPSSGENHSAVVDDAPETPAANTPSSQKLTVAHP